MGESADMTPTQSRDLAGLMEQAARILRFHAETPRPERVKQALDEVRRMMEGCDV